MNLISLCGIKNGVLKQKNKDLYREFANRVKLPLFFEPWWLDAVCGQNQWEVVLSLNAAGDVKGVFPYYRSEIKGLKVLRNPDFVPYLGGMVFYPDNTGVNASSYSFENKVMQSLIDQLPKNVSLINMNLHHSIQNGYPFYWNGFHLHTRYTYTLKNIGDHVSLSKGMSQTLRRQIKLAYDAHEVSIADDPDILYDLLVKSLKKQGVRHRIHRDMLHRMYYASQNKGQGRILVAKNKSDQAVAAMLLVWDHDTAYCLALGMDHRLEQTHGAKLLIRDSIIYASQFAENYDFEGSMAPNVERIYRSFGGERIPYQNIIWFKNRWIKALWYFFK